MSGLIAPDAPALDAAEACARELCIDVFREHLRWIIEAFLDAESQDIAAGSDGAASDLLDTFGPSYSNPEKGATR